MKFINLTPHPVRIQLDDDFYGLVSEGVARCSQLDSAPRRLILEDAYPSSVEVVTRSYGQVEGLPAPKPGVGYIVSQIVAQALPARRDLFFPGDPLRDKDANIIGCKNLCQVS